MCKFHKSQHFNTSNFGDIKKVLLIILIQNYGNFLTVQKMCKAVSVANIFQFTMREFVGIDLGNRLFMVI